MTIWKYLLHKHKQRPANFGAMNSLPKLIASISALIASLSFTWLTLTITGAIPYRHVTVFHDGSVAVVQMTHPGSAADTD
jgi:hypothetical protein